MRIALIGFGGVGKAFTRLLEEKKEELNRKNISISLTYIIRSQGGVYDPLGITNSSSLIFNPAITFQSLIKRRDVDLLVEATPTNKETGEPGLTHIAEALNSGIHVVTANKGPVLLAYRDLYVMAKRNHVQFAIGCTTGGALPVINAGLFDMAGASISSIEGILNGTSNFIFQEMELNGTSYLDALKKAQGMGIAETDSTLDVEGWDTAIKLLILVNVLMGENKKLSDICVEGITTISAGKIQEVRRDGKRTKLIGKARKTGNDVILSVQSETIDSSHPLYGVNGTNKAVRFISDSLGELTIIGGASGTTSAAASLLRDIINIQKGYQFVS